MGRAIPLQTSVRLGSLRVRGLGCMYRRFGAGQAGRQSEAFGFLRGALVCGDSVAVDRMRCAYGYSCATTKTLQQMGDSMPIS